MTQKLGTDFKKLTSGTELTFIGDSKGKHKLAEKVLQC